MSYPGAKSLKKEDGKRYYFYVRKNYMAFPEGGSADEFDSLSKEYIENVFHKNNLIKAYYPHVHLYGTNSRDFIEVFVVESMADLEKMFESNDKLYKEHWPDEAKRKDMEAKWKNIFFLITLIIYTGWFPNYLKVSFKRTVESVLGFLSDEEYLTYF